MKNCNYNQNECGSTCKYPNCGGSTMSKLSAKEFLNNKGYGPATNYTTGAAAVLMEQFTTARLEAYKAELGKASELKNTPWRIEMHYEPNSDKDYVVDAKGQNITVPLSKPTAKAIASLPDTLKRLEELEDAALPILATWEHSDGTERLSELFWNLKKALEQ